MKPYASIFDLDGTLAIHPEGRDPRNHENCENDFINSNILEMIYGCIDNASEIIFLTKRSVIFQMQTYRFLTNICGINFPFLLVMRDENDNSDSPTFKSKKLDEISKVFNITSFVDDDDRNLKVANDKNIENVIDATLWR